MKTIHRFAASLLPVLVIAVLAGCSKNKPEVAAEPPPPPPAPPAEAPAPPPPAPEPPPAEDPVKVVQDRMADVFFDYDSAALSSSAQSTLDANGGALNQYANVSATIEGHCDERGTVEYNLALGDRRAQAAKDYLVRYGVPTSRLSTISYGEERPFATGSGEDAWAQNRRAHFVVR